ncbi:hypothetical protein GCM10028785_15720 [Hydrogenophaga soli]
MLDTVLTQPEGKTLGACANTSDGRLVVRLAQAMPAIHQPATSTEQVTEQVTEQATTQVMKLLVTLAVGPLGTKAAMGAMGLSHRPTFIQNYLQPALNTGWIEMTQPQSPNSPTQKYRLTASGSKQLKLQKQ